MWKVGEKIIFYRKFIKTYINFLFRRNEKMTKKIFCLVVVATMLCSVFAVSTSASIATSKRILKKTSQDPQTR